MKKMNRMTLLACGILGAVAIAGASVAFDGRSAIEAEATSTSLVGDVAFYLTPGIWNTDGARFAFAFLNSDKTTTNWTGFLHEVEGDANHVYETTVPSGTWTYVIAVRFDPTVTEAQIGWGDASKVWNQTNDITVGYFNGVQITGWIDGSKICNSTTYSYSKADRANLWGTEFSSALSSGCDATGVTPLSTEIWSSRATQYSYLGTDVKSLIAGTTADSSSGNSTAKALAAYDYVIGKYGTTTYSDFIGRSSAPDANRDVLNVSSYQNVEVYLLVGMVFLASALAVAYSFSHKTKVSE